MVATFPQLEYPRHWPPGVEVTGPMEFELPYGDVELPPGDAPLVLVAPSTAKDPECRLVRVALEGLAEEPVRVVATTNRARPEEPIEVPDNALLVDWLSYMALPSRRSQPRSLTMAKGDEDTPKRAARRSDFLVLRRGNLQAVVAAIQRRGVHVTVHRDHQAAGGQQPHAAA